MAAFENIREIIIKKNRREKILNYPPAMRVSIMPCYKWGRFYQQQIQAVGFYGGLEACVASVMQCPLCVPVRFPRGSAGD